MVLGGLVVPHWAAGRQAASGLAVYQAVSWLAAAVLLAGCFCSYSAVVERCSAGGSLVWWAVDVLGPVDEPAPGSFVEETFVGMLFVEESFVTFFVRSPS